MPRQVNYVLRDLLEVARNARLGPKAQVVIDEAAVYLAQFKSGDPLPTPGVDPDPYEPEQEDLQIATEVEELEMEEEPEIEVSMDEIDPPEEEEEEPDQSADTATFSVSPVEELDTVDEEPGEEPEPVVVDKPAGKRSRKSKEQKP